MLAGSDCDEVIPALDEGAVPVVPNCEAILDYRKADYYRLPAEGHKPKQLNLTQYVPVDHVAGKAGGSTGVNCTSGFATKRRSRGVFTCLTASSKLHGSVVDIWRSMGCGMVIVVAPNAAMT